MVYRLSAYAFPITEAVEEVLLAKGFRGQSTVCPLPLDPVIYRPRGFEKIRAFIPRREDEVVIGYVGRILVKPKGLRTLAAALPSLRDLSWKLVVIGKGDLEETFRQILREGGVADRVNLLGFVPHAETCRFLSAFDILVVPSGDSAELERAIWPRNYRGARLRDSSGWIIVRGESQVS